MTTRSATFDVVAALARAVKRLRRGEPVGSPHVFVLHDAPRRIGQLTREHQHDESAWCDRRVRPSRLSQVAIPLKPRRRRARNDPRAGPPQPCNRSDTDRTSES